MHRPLAIIAIGALALTGCSSTPEPERSEAAFLEDMEAAGISGGDLVAEGDELCSLAEDLEESPYTIAGRYGGMRALSMGEEAGERYLEVGRAAAEHLCPEL